MASSSSTCSDEFKRVQTLERHFQKKMVTSSSDLPLKPIKTKPEWQKSSSRRMSRESSMRSSSSEYYADASVAVPFRWESQPGTPKIRYSEISIPPLTPPPSYTYSPAKRHVKKQPKSTTILQNVLPKLNFGKNHPQSTPATPIWRNSLSSSPLSSSCSVPSSPYNPISGGQSRQSSSTSSSESRVDSDDYGSPVSILCFGLGRRSNARSYDVSPNSIKIMLGA